MTTSNVSTIFSGKEIDRRFLIICSDQSIWEFGGVNWIDRTGADVQDGWGLRWSGGWLTGGFTFANRKAVRSFRPGIDAVSQPMLYNGGVGQPSNETWESKGYGARVFRPFRQYMMAGAPNWGSSFFPNRVQWCAAVEPGQVPVDWEPRPDNDAGDIDLADTPGSVVDMVSLRDTLLILREDAIHVCNWIGGNQVFSFRRITTAKGMHTQDCAVEYQSKVWCQGIDDIFMTDGNTVQSIVWGRVKDTWLEDKDESRSQYAFTVADPIREEILFFYVSKNAPPEYVYPDRALVFDVNTNAFFFREYDLEVPHAHVALTVEPGLKAELIVYGIDRGGSRLLSLESAPDRMGAPVSSYFIRSGLFSAPGHDWVQVDQAKVHISGNVATLQLGGQQAPDAAIDWRPAISSDPSVDYKIDARHNAQLIAARVDISAQSKWRIGSMELLIQKAGER